MVNLYMPIARTLLFPEGLSGHFIARSQRRRSAKEGRAQGAVRIGGASEPPGPQAPPLALRPRSHLSVAAKTSWALLSEGKHYGRSRSLPSGHASSGPCHLRPHRSPGFSPPCFAFSLPLLERKGPDGKNCFFFFLHVLLHPHCLELGTENALSEGVFNE